MRRFTILPLIALWAVLTAFAWFGPAKDSSDAERRPLAQAPEISADAVLDGSFMTDFETYSLDQFPLRDGFRTVKSLFHYYVLGQKDNNGIYLSQGFAAKQEYPLDLESVDHALDRFRRVYDKYLQNSDVYMAIVPDKGCYLAEDAGQLKLDYDGMYEAFRDGMPWAQHIDLRPVLTGEDYYRTDTHWRQEKLIPAAQVLCQALGTKAPQAEDFAVTALETPFYGVYYGQAALPMEPETLYVLENERLANCTVYDFESGKTLGIYDWEKEQGKDLYEVFLSGARSLLTITNPAGDPEKELLIFRDSFGSAVAPLLMGDYGKVTLIDIRYIQMDVLDRFMEFTGQDALFLYSTLVLNNSETIK